MTDTNFSIVYDGRPVSEGTMDARDLAPSLLALADLVDEAAPLIDPSLPRVSVRVRPDFEEGSFEIFLELANLYDQFINLFSSSEAQAWATFFAITGISGVGVLQLIKRAKGREPTKVTFEKKETVTVTFEGEDPFTVDRKVWDLFKNLRARQAIEKLIGPLLSRGFDSFKIRRNGKESFSVDESEAAYFRAPTVHEGETTSDSEARLVIVSPSFNSGNKWRVSDGNRTIYVSILDENFELAVQHGTEVFRKGDILVVTLRTTQWVEDEKLHAEYFILKVHQHLPGPEQSNLW